MSNLIQTGAKYLFQKSVICWYGGIIKYIFVETKHFYDISSWVFVLYDMWSAGKQKIRPGRKRDRFPL